MDDTAPKKRMATYRNDSTEPRRWIPHNGPERILQPGESVEYETSGVDPSYFDESVAGPAPLPATPPLPPWASALWERDPGREPFEGRAFPGDALPWFATTPGGGAAIVVEERAVSVPYGSDAMRCIPIRLRAHGEARRRAELAEGALQRLLPDGEAPVGATIADAVRVAERFLAAMDLPPGSTGPAMAEAAEGMRRERDAALARVAWLEEQARVWDMVPALARAEAAERERDSLRSELEATRQLLRDAIAAIDETPRAAVDGHREREIAGRLTAEPDGTGAP